MKESKFNFKANTEFLGRLQRAAKALNRPASQIVREAVDEKLERDAKRNQKLKAALEAVV